MTEKEKKILELLSEAIPKMDDFNKGYLLGMAESKAAAERAAEQEVQNV